VSSFHLDLSTHVLTFPISSEDLVIDAIYNSLLTGRLDQQKQRVEVDWVMGRDVRPEGGVGALQASLSAWYDRVRGLIQQLDSRISEIRQVECAVLPSGPITELTLGVCDGSAQEAEKAKIQTEAIQKTIVQLQSKKGKSSRGDNGFGHTMDLDEMTHSRYARRRFSSLV
jgi:hypothetical protein